MKLFDALRMACLAVFCSGPGWASCPQPFMDENFERIIFPGEPGYVPHDYARHLYQRFQRSFQNPQIEVFLGTLTTQYDDLGLLPHLEHWQDDNLLGGPAEEQYEGQPYYDLTYRYAQFYDLQGNIVSEGGLVPIVFEVADLEIDIVSQYHWPTAFTVQESSMFEIRLEQYRAVVPGSVCFEYVWPAPTPAAFEHLQACIANAGCEGQ